MKAYFSRHIAPLCLLLCIAVLLAAFLGVRLSADAGTYALVHKSGDAAQLDDLTIRLVLGDSRHEQHITIDGGALTHRFSAVPPWDNFIPSIYLPDQELTEDPNADVRVEVKTFTEDTADDHISLRDVMTRYADRARLSVLFHAESAVGSYRRVRVLTDLYVQDDAHSFVSTLERYRNRYRYIKPDGETGWNETGGYYGEAAEESIWMEDTGAYDEREFQAPDALQAANVILADLYATDSTNRLYFTPGVRPYMQGECAVYRVEEWTKNENYTELASRDGYDYYVPAAAIPLGKVTKLASFPVQNTTMLRLDIVEDRVCLLYIEGGMLTFRAYATDGALIAQTPLFALDSNVSYSTGLRSNRGGDSSMLCYTLQVHSELAEAEPQDLVCVELTSSSAALRSRIRPDFDFIDNAFFGGRWALLRSDRMTGSSPNSMYTPQRFTLELLDVNGNSLYAGEIVTDAPEDHLQYYGRKAGSSYPAPLNYSYVRWLRFADDPISGR